MKRPPFTYKLDDVAKRYWVSSTTVRNWIDKGVLKAKSRKTGSRRSFFVTPDQVHDFEQRTGATPFDSKHASTWSEIGKNSQAAPHALRDHYRLSACKKARNAE